jgi:hypothetical protein
MNRDYHGRFTPRQPPTPSDIEAANPSKFTSKRVNLPDGSVTRHSYRTVEPERVIPAPTAAEKQPEIEPTEHHVRECLEKLDAELTKAETEAEALDRFVNSPEYQKRKSEALIAAAANPPSPDEDAATARRRKMDEDMRLAAQNPPPGQFVPYGPSPQNPPPKLRIEIPTAPPHDPQQQFTAVNRVRKQPPTIYDKAFDRVLAAFVYFVGGAISIVVAFAILLGSELFALRHLMETFTACS